MIDEFAESLISIIDTILPDSPFKLISNSPVSGFLGSLNWIFPIDEMIAILQLWLPAITIFYIVQVALRWAKAIE